MTEFSDWSVWTVEVTANDWFLWIAELTEIDD
jgi:hypothetical protein